MEVFIFFSPLIFLILGLIIRFIKPKFIISSYNTFSKEEKAKYDEEYIWKFAGNLSFILTGALIIIAIGKALSFTYFTYILVFGLIIIAAVIYMQTGKRLRKQ